ncbi:hypothetical protein WMY93_025830 [Mugilogobius chulae]|uniref:C-type lectin domain-containing protein n=1 Tax=Mugilogobius chulae TaxID=88201 RepID=A0AAW0MXE4_9GOBI
MKTEAEIGNISVSMPSTAYLRREQAALERHMRIKRIFTLTIGLCAMAAAALSLGVIMLELETQQSSSVNVTHPTPPLIAALTKELTELAPEEAELTRELAEFNLSRSQWAVDTYCNQKNAASERVCKHCAPGWKFNFGYCYLVKSDAVGNYTEASKYCKDREAKVVVVRDMETEWPYVCSQSVAFPNSIGYWLGLTFDGHDWRWADGTLLDHNTAKWIEPPSDATHCVIAFSENCDGGWNPYPCSYTQKWICQKKSMFA